MEPAAREERALDSWRRGGARCCQRKLGGQKREVGRNVGSGSSESLTVARAGHTECGWMQPRVRPGKQLSVLWCKPGHVMGPSAAQVCRGPLASQGHLSGVPPTALRAEGSQEPSLSLSSLSPAPRSMPASCWLHAASLDLSLPRGPQGGKSVDLTGPLCGLS